jgi:hypothetical protein
MDNISYSAYNGAISVVSMLLEVMNFFTREKPSINSLELGHIPSSCIAISLMSIFKDITSMFPPQRIQLLQEEMNLFTLLSQDQ